LLKGGKYYEFKKSGIEKNCTGVRPSAFRDRMEARRFVKASDYY
jgi:hypothetical protein